MDILVEATHVICQPRITQLSAEDYKALEKANVICVGLPFLNACIVSDEMPKPDAFLFKQ